MPGGVAGCLRSAGKWLSAIEASLHAQLPMFIRCRSSDELIFTFRLFLLFADRTHRNLYLFFASSRLRARRNIGSGRRRHRYRKIFNLTLRSYLGVRVSCFYDQKKKKKKKKRKKEKKKSKRNAFTGKIANRLISTILVIFTLSVLYLFVCSGPTLGQFTSSNSIIFN